MGNIFFIFYKLLEVMNMVEYGLRRVIAGNGESLKSLLGKMSA